MKTINVFLNQSSITNAIKKLQQTQKEIDTMLDEFLAECCKWFIDRANIYVKTGHRGSNVEQDIITSWTYVVGGGVATIKNNSDKAVYVEFGVGLLGEQNPHPNAKITDYNYNIQNNSKFKSYNGEDWWIFKLETEDDLDLYPEDYLFKYARSGLYFVTKGSWGTMFAHRTIVDMVIQPKAIQRLWEKVKQKHWGN
jgi:hypothetical protein